ncbi:MAG: lasso peptide isopeptide bond-forming cyclase [Oculatellaceae cyanobacterium Prado106]|jgi:asparagine synthase (glutamine-hydrolysing)|nr:lasso peptide isopeptide bond-forming cyclase [Oculatellaceae cyanobacterium Prado106]
MSGILGLFYRDRRSVTAAEMSDMMTCLSHRGGDGSGTWIEGCCVGLGHQMLWTTPESLLEKQPLVQSSYVLTADARIDNRDELIAELGLTAPVEKITDSDLILAAYEKWQEACPEHLLGDFAFAIWDQHKQQMFCARDHFGVKPFYYHCTDQVFVFASEIKALLAIASVPRELNEARVANYLLTEFDDTSITFYQDIFRLPPAHTLTVCADSLQTNLYWQLNPYQSLQFETAEQYAEEFRKIFTEAVRCRLRSALPVGSMLSGGLDSSSITCVASRLLAGQKLSTFSALFEQVPECDERPYIHAVLEQENLASHDIHGDRISPLIDLDRVMWHQDQPLSAYNLYLNWSLYKVAQGCNTRVILDGFDGDSTVSHGTAYLKDLLQARQWLRLYQEIRGLTEHFNPKFRGMFWQILWRSKVRGAIAKIPPLHKVQRAVNKIWRWLKPAAPQNSIAWDDTIHPDFIQRLQLETRRQQNLISIPQDLSAAKAEHYYNLVRGVMPHTLENLDHAAAAFSIELRFPFWDKRLIEFCLAIPPEQKMGQGWTRLVMRQAMAGILPESVQWRKGKANMGFGFDYSFLAYERDRLAGFWDYPWKSASYLNFGRLRLTGERFLNQTFHDSDVSNLWQAMNLSLWLEQTALGCMSTDKEPMIEQPLRTTVQDSIQDSNSSSVGCQST